MHKCHIADSHIINEKIFIMLTRPCNLHPRTPHFYIVNLVFTGLNIIFLIFAVKHRSWVYVLIKKFHPKITVCAIKNHCILHTHVIIMAEKINPVNVLSFWTDRPMQTVKTQKANANSVHLDQTAPRGGVWSGSVLSASFGGFSLQ